MGLEGQTAKVRKAVWPFIICMGRAMLILCGAKGLGIPGPPKSSASSAAELAKSLYSVSSQSTEIRGTIYLDERVAYLFCPS